MALSSAGLGSKLQQPDGGAGSNTIGENSSSTQRWNDVPRETMDEVSSHGSLDLPTIGEAALKIVPSHSRIPLWNGLRADSEEKHVAREDVEHCRGG